MGKTNILDAIYFLSFTKSAISSADSYCIRHDEDYFMIKGEYLRKDALETIYTALKRRSKKVFKRGEKAYERMSEHIGFLPAISISPMDMELIAEGSDERRRFMDVVIAQYDNQYLKYLSQYNKLLQSRNALLKREDGVDDTILEIYDTQMSELAHYICSKRKEFIEGFTPLFQNYYQAISNNNEVAELRYVSHHDKGELSSLLAECRNRDKAIGYTTRGAHKDDIEISLNGYAVKRTGSQGQNKSFLFALKLAQYTYLKKVIDIVPILLVDDIFDKLDSRRVENIITLLSSDEFGQIFITDTNRQHTNDILKNTNTSHKIFTVEDGAVTN